MHVLFLSTSVQMLLKQGVKVFELVAIFCGSTCNTNVTVKML